MENNGELKATEFSLNDADEISIYDYGHFEGLVFILNEALPGPGGQGIIEKIDFTAAFPDMDRLPGGAETVVAGFIMNYMDFEDATEAETQKIMGYKYN